MHRGRRHGMGLILLGMQLGRIGFDRIPPVTLATIGFNVAVHLNVLSQWFPSIRHVCISVYEVFYRKSWRRLLLGAFYHGDDWHLYYNMASFVWKGITLERKFKSAYFAYLIAVFTLLTNIVLVGLNMLLEYALDDPSYSTQCAVGFSGVLFALKVLTTYYTPPGTNYVMGFIPVPSRMVVWAELVLIQVLVPNASFTGHLAGILVGLLYVKGPLKGVMDIFVPAAPSYTYNAGSSGHRSNPGRNSGHRLGGERSYDSAAFTGGLNEEEQMRRAMTDSQQQGGNPYPHRRPNPSAPVMDDQGPDLEDLRQRRLNRYR